MKKNSLYIGLTLLLCFALAACDNASTDTTSNDTGNTLSFALQNQSQDIDNLDIDLYASFAAGSVQADELDLIKTKAITVPEITAEIIAMELSEWSGLDFTLDDVKQSEKTLTIDWSVDSTLIANLDDRTQKEDFYFFDSDSMRWFMMDSLYQSCMENMNIDEVYYTMDGGKELSFEELYPVAIFPTDVPYMGSSFYFAHADVKGEMGEEWSDIGDMADYGPTEGRWRLNGASDTAFLLMDGEGLYTAFYASGSVESNGYLTYYSEDGRYEMFDEQHTLWDVFYILDTNELILGYDGERIYKKE